MIRYVLLLYFFCIGCISCDKNRTDIIRLHDALQPEYEKEKEIFMNKIRIKMFDVGNATIEKLETQRVQWEKTLSDALHERLLDTFQKLQQNNVIKCETYSTYFIT